MIDAEEVLRLKQDFKEMKLDITTIKGDMVSMKASLSTLPSIDNSLSQMASAFTKLERIAEKLVDFIIKNTKYAFGGLMMIILGAMGIKGILDLIQFFK